MGGFSTRAISTADRLIDKYGDDVTLINRYDCVYNPTTGKEICTEDNYPVKGSVSAYTIQEAESENVTVDDLRVLTRIPLEIQKTWQVSYDNKLWEVIDVTKIRTQNDTVTQALQIRALGE